MGCQHPDWPPSGVFRSGTATWRVSRKMRGIFTTAARWVVSWPDVAVGGVAQAGPGKAMARPNGRAPVTRTGPSLTRLFLNPKDMTVNRTRTEQRHERDGPASPLFRRIRQAFPDPARQARPDGAAEARQAGGHAIP